MKNILLVRTDRIGDVILSLPMLPVLKRHFPDVRITVLVRTYTRELVERHSCVDNVLLYENENKLRALWQTLRQIRARKFDLVIIPYPRFRSTLLMFLAGIPLRVGTGYRWYSSLLNRKVYEHRKDARRHEVEYNLNLLRAVGIESPGPPQFELTTSDAAEKRVDAFLAGVSLEKDGRFVILHPGSGGSARDWSAGNFSTLGTMIASRLGIRVVVTGGKGEETLVAQVAAGMKPEPVTVSGELSLLELTALIKRAQVFVSNSTGPMHIAAVVGTPVIAFFPPIIQCSPVRWGPFTGKKKIFLADNNLCTLCHGSPCRSNECMDQITAENVFSAVTKFLN